MILILLLLLQALGIGSFQIEIKCGLLLSTQIIGGRIIRIRILLICNAGRSALHLRVVPIRSGSVDPVVFVICIVFAA